MGTFKRRKNEKSGYHGTSTNYNIVHAFKVGTDKANN